MGPSSLPHAAAKLRTAMVDTAAKRRSIDMRMTSSAAKCWRGGAPRLGVLRNGYNESARERDLVMNWSRRRHTARQLRPPDESGLNESADAILLARHRALRHAVRRIEQILRVDARRECAGHRESNRQIEARCAIAR